MGKKDEAFNFFEKAFYIYEAAKGKDSIECADIAGKLAEINFLYGKFKEVYSFSKLAIEIYERNEEANIERMIELCLLVCEISEREGKY